MEFLFRTSAKMEYKVANLPACFFGRSRDQRYFSHVSTLCTTGWSSSFGWFPDRVWILKRIQISKEVIPCGDRLQLEVHKWLVTIMLIHSPRCKVCVATECLGKSDTLHRLFLDLNELCFEFHRFHKLSLVHEVLL